MTLELQDLINQRTELGIKIKELKSIENVKFGSMTNEADLESTLVCPKCKSNRFKSSRCDFPLDCGIKAYAQSEPLNAFVQANKIVNAQMKAVEHIWDEVGKNGK